MYSPISSTFICELEVSPSYRVSRRDDKPIIPSRVEKAVISTSGKWMATVDNRNGDTGFRAEVYLKIWSWATKERNWVLNTRVDQPHGTHKVTYCSFSPISDTGDRAYLVTTGEDGLIKVWRAHQKGSDSESSMFNGYFWKFCFALLSFFFQSSGHLLQLSPFTQRSQEYFHGHLMPPFLLSPLDLTLRYMTRSPAAFVKH